VCIACVSTAHARWPASPGLQDPGELAGWSAGETAKAMIVCRQLPRWSRQLFDLLSSAPRRRFPRSAVQASLVGLGDTRFSVEDACDWATAFCAASGKILPVRRETPATGETVYWMDQPAADLFHAVITASAA
jgi:hypothetical protein